jgi:hypothetical protein
MRAAPLRHGHAVLLCRARRIAARKRGPGAAGKACIMITIQRCLAFLVVLASKRTVGGRRDGRDFAEFSPAGTLNRWRLAWLAALLLTSGTTVAAPMISVSRTLLDWGNVSFGVPTTPQSFDVTNVGDAPLNLTAYLMLGYSGFDQGGPCDNVFTLAPGATCRMDITLTVTNRGAGQIAGRFEIDSNGGTARVDLRAFNTGDAGPPPVVNYGGMWWKAPAGSESGWGINFAHQGDIIFATWFTYDLTGRAWWLTMSANKTAPGVYSGTLFQTRGPALSALQWSPSAVVATSVGTGTLTFSDKDNGTFAYTVNGVAQTKAITKTVFGTLPACTFGAQPNLALATNFQDIWWAAPAGVESGWGDNFAQWGDVIFAAWFTYDLDSSPLWLTATLDKTGPGNYTGQLFRSTGPPFNAVPFVPANVVLTAVGTLTLTFAHGNSATFAYTVLLGGPTNVAVNQSKPIVRTVFVEPGTVCQ